MTDSRPKRVLLVDDDAVVLGVGGDLLHAGGYAVQLLMHPTLSVPTAEQFKPDVIILDINMPVINGREVMTSLKAFATTARVPVVFVSSPLPPREQLRAFFNGAIDLWAKPLNRKHVDRLGKVLAQFETMQAEPPASAAEGLRNRVLAFFAREKSDGALVVNPSTPFEGRAIFSGGALTWARMGPLTEAAALDEMLSLTDGVWRWEDGMLEPPMPSSVVYPAPAGYRPKVLLVDDDPSLRKLYALQLQRAGFEVVAADHGEAGHRLASQTAFDMMVADLNMPVLDGWGMLKLLKGAPRTRELPVLVLSAHDDYRETLKAARAGAHDYLRKTGHADELIKRVRLLAAPRVATWETLRMKQSLKRFEVASIGAQWLLRTIGDHECSGSIWAVDDWGTYRITIDRGYLIEALAEAGGRKVVGIDAVAAFIVSRGTQASFELVAPRMEEPAGPWLVEAVEEACNHVADLEAGIVDDRLRRATHFNVDPELAALFDRIGSDADLRILRAIVGKEVGPSGLAEHLDLPQEVVDAGLKELVRRGVVRV
jgi:DNA-binding response OmpR family regulator